ncbi:glycosyltransferase family 2 protein [Sphingobacterium faecium]|uniref:glycosyltransferase family 2 protein n=1 Tax=Sphingobacterium faecium TaxID=34087 RepID=UPI00320B2A80
MVFKKDMISIILPCYNVEKYLARAIKSILNQNCNYFELLIIIDGSPDNSKLIAEEYAKEDPRIKVFEKPNGGLSDARNFGLERAEGEFVYFMDSDDWIDNGLLLDNVKILEEDSLDFIIFGYTQDNEDLEGNVLSFRNVIPKLNYLSSTSHSPAVIDSHTLGLMGYAWNKIYRRDFLMKNNIWFEKGTSLVEDILFNVQVYNNSDKIVFNKRAYYHYINRPVVTLIKTFHRNSFQLKSRKVEVLKEMFQKWHIQNSNSILSQNMMQGIRYCLTNLYGFKNNLSRKEKHQYIKLMYDDVLTNELIKFYKPQNLRDRVFKIMVEKKMVRTTSLMYSILRK